MQHARWPNLFVVGAPKAGTTSLWRYLDEHPDIFMSPMRDPTFFASVPYIPTVKRADSYLGLFSEARDQRFRGEVSVNYLSAEQAPEAIHRRSPDSRIVISLREPVELSHTLYLMWAGSGRERRTFRQAIRDEVVDGIEHSNLPLYVRRATYAPAVERYFRTFEAQVFVLFFEELVADTRGVVRRLFEFLELDPSPADRFDPRPHNQFEMPRNRLAGRLVSSQRTVRIAQAIVPHRWRDPIFRALVPPGTPKPEPDPESVEMLRQTFEPDVAALRQLLGRPLPKAWERRFPAAARSAAGTR